MIAIILVFVLYYITFGILTSYLGSKIFKRANMKATGFVTFLYGLLWPFFLKHIIPGIKDIICKDATQAAVKETVEYIEKREELKTLEQQMAIQTTNVLVGNNIDPDNIQIPEDAIPIKQNTEDQSQPIQNKEQDTVHPDALINFVKPNEDKNLEGMGALKSTVTYELNQCPKCGKKDQLVFIDNKKVACKFCNNWAYIEDAVNSSWLNKVKEVKE